MGADHGICLVGFMDCDVGCIDLEEKRCSHGEALRFEERPLRVFAGAFARSDVDVATLASESLKAPARGVERLLTELQEAWNTLAEIKRRLLDASTEIRQHSHVSETLGQTKE